MADFHMPKRAVLMLFLAVFAAGAALLAYPFPAEDVTVVAYEDLLADGEETLSNDVKTINALKSTLEFMTDIADSEIVFDRGAALTVTVIIQTSSGSELSTERQKQVKQFVSSALKDISEENVVIFS